MFSSKNESMLDFCHIFAGWCGSSHGQAVRQRLQSDDHLSLWGPQPELQEHVQAEAPAAEMAGWCRHDGSQPSPAGTSQLTGWHQQEEKEAHQHRDQHPDIAGEELPPAAQAHVGGDYHDGWESGHGEGGGQSVVLQPAPERGSASILRYLTWVWLASSTTTLIMPSPPSTWHPPVRSSRSNRLPRVHPSLRPHPPPPVSWPRLSLRQHPTSTHIMATASAASGQNATPVQTKTIAVPSRTIAVNLVSATNGQATTAATTTVTPIAITAVTPAASSHPQMSLVGAHTATSSQPQMSLVSAHKAIIAVPASQKVATSNATATSTSAAAALMQTANQLASLAAANNISTAANTPSKGWSLTKGLHASLGICEYIFLRKDICSVSYFEEALIPGILQILHCFFMIHNCHKILHNNEIDVYFPDLSTFYSYFINYIVCLWKYYYLYTFSCPSYRHGIYEPSQTPCKLNDVCNGL